MAVVVEKKMVDVAGPNIRVENGRRALGRMAANFYGHPCKEVQVIGLTGTNGKTSTAMLIQALFETGGLRCGLLGTVGNDTGKGRIPAKQTTPEALDFQQLLAEMRENGCRVAAVEVSFGLPWEFGRVREGEESAFPRITSWLVCGDQSGRSGRSPHDGALFSWGKGDDLRSGEGGRAYARSKDGVGREYFYFVHAGRRGASEFALVGAV